MNCTEKKKAPNENTDIPKQAVNPAVLVKAPKLLSKVEFSQNDKKKPITMTRSKNYDI